MEEEQKEIVDFFKNLSLRNWIENDLSDMLWALLKVSYEFRKIFFDLLIEKSKGYLSYTKKSDFINIEREVVENEISGRPDIKFLFANKKELILEVKTYDKNYHVEKYSSLAEKDICVLTYFDCSDELPQNWPKIKWDELVEKTKNSESELILGFSLFIKGVFSMKEIRKITEFKIEELVFINHMIEKSLNELNCEIDKRSKAFFVDGSGYYIKYHLKESNQNIYPWIGINYNVEQESGNPCGLMIWLNEYINTHKNINEYLQNKEKREKIFPLNIFHVNVGAKQVAIMPKDWKNKFLRINNATEQLSNIIEFVSMSLEKIDSIDKALIEFTSEENIQLKEVVN